MTGGRTLSVVAGISLVYDLAVGVVLLAAPGSLATLFGARLPDPVLFVRLNAIFLIAVGLGYWQPYKRPDAYRAYMWVFGPILKGAGAVIFVADYLSGGSPASFLLFAASDGTLALVTLGALLKKP